MFQYSLIVAFLLSLTYSHRPLRDVFLTLSLFQKAPIYDTTKLELKISLDFSFFSIVNIL